MFFPLCRKNYLLLTTDNKFSVRLADDQTMEWQVAVTVFLLLVAYLLSE